MKYIFKGKSSRLLRGSFIIHGKPLDFNQIMVSDYKQGSFTAETTAYYNQMIYLDIPLNKIPIISGHKYLCSVDIERTISGNNGIAVVLWLKSGTNYSVGLLNQQDNGTATSLITAPATSYIDKISINNYAYKRGFSEGDTVSFDNLMLFDLTQMFGAGNEPTAEEFERMFSADYYPYIESEIIYLYEE